MTFKYRKCDIYIMCFAFYVFVRLSSHREIKVLVALFPLCFVVELTGGIFATIVITFAMLVKEAI